MGLGAGCQLGCTRPANGSSRRRQWATLCVQADPPIAALRTSPLRGPAPLARYRERVAARSETNPGAGVVFSIGYEGRSASNLVDELVERGVAVLVDVRQNAISRKAGLSKSNLRSAVQDAGLQYVHLRGLGNPKDNRDGFRSADPTSAREVFRTLMHQSAESRDALSTLLMLSTEGSVALLCYERDSALCHRSVVIEELRDLGATEEVISID